MITTQATPNGYIYNLNHEMIAVGSYQSNGFELLETDNTTSIHTSGMMALLYIRKKYTPEFYRMPVKKHNIIAPRVELETA